MKVSLKEHDQQLFSQLFIIGLVSFVLVSCYFLFPPFQKFVDGSRPIRYRDIEKIHNSH